MTQKWKTAVAATHLLAKSVHNRTVRKRSVDGCTLSPEFIFHQCCDRHDMAYIGHHERVEQRRWQDFGPADDRYRVDRWFLECMLRRARGHRGWEFMALVYYAAVRIFGGLYWNARRKD